MFSWIKSNLSNKFIATLIASVFIAMTIACFTMITTESHTGDFGAACEIIMDLVDNTVVQTGFVLLIVTAMVWLGFNARIFPTQSELVARLMNLYSPPLHNQLFPREYCFLRQLFSSGIIHPKLHSFSL